MGQYLNSVKNKEMANDNVNNVNGNGNRPTER